MSSPIEIATAEIPEGLTEFNAGVLELVDDDSLMWRFVTIGLVGAAGSSVEMMMTRETAEGLGEMLLTAARTIPSDAASESDTE